MQTPRKISLYDIMASAFPQLELFELDGDRQLVRSRAGVLDFGSLAPKLPLSGETSISFGQVRFSVYVFPIHPGYVCAAFPENDVSALDMSAAVTSMAELYFSIDESQDDERSHSDGTTFLSQLFQMNAPDPTNITLLAADMDLDLSLRRLVAVFQVSPGSALDRVEDLLRRRIEPSHQDIFGPVSDDCIVCGKVIEDMRDADLEQLREFYNSTVHELALPEGVSINCGVGVVVSDMFEYPLGLRMARMALTQGKEVSWVHEHILELVLERITPEMLHHFLGTYFLYMDNNPTVYDTIHALVQRNMDLAAAASDCGIHRNTLVFRLNQLRSVWNINPIQNDNDRFLLILLDHCYKNFQKIAEE